MRRLFITCWDKFCVLAGLGWVWSKKCWDIILVLLPWEVFIWTRDKVNFMPSLVREGVWSSLVEMHFFLPIHGIGFVNTSWDTYCVIACMGGVWSKHVKSHFVSSQAWEVFGQHMLRYIWWNHCNRRGLVNACCDALVFLAGIRCVSSTYVNMHFVSSMAWCWRELSGRSGHGQQWLFWIGASACCASANSVRHIRSVWSSQHTWGTSSSVMLHETLGSQGGVRGRAPQNHG